MAGVSACCLSGCKKTRFAKTPIPRCRTFNPAVRIFAFIRPVCRNFAFIDIVWSHFGSLAEANDGDALDVEGAGLFNVAAGYQALAVSQQNDLEHDTGS